MSACSICRRLRSRRRKTRLADGAAKVTWIAADVTTWLPDARYDIWHNRAAFHFLAAPDAQRAYVARLKLALRGGGHAIIATFALDGPKKCSGLPVSLHSRRDYRRIARRRVRLDRHAAASALNALGIGAEIPVLDLHASC
jgi:hypothetical protein